MPNKIKKIIITGASRGLGYEIAQLCVEEGFEVLGTVRKQIDKANLEHIGCQAGYLDFNNRESIQTFSQSVLDFVGQNSFVLINNAGTIFPSSVEEITPHDLRKQFEVNLFGPIELTQKLLPALRENKGRVIMISSLSVAMTSPLTGAYSATKRALDAFTEVLAMETMPFGVDVINVHPGGYQTSIWATGDKHGQRYLDSNSPYYPFMLGIEAAVKKQKLGKAQYFAKVVLRAITDPKPKFDYLSPSKIKWLFRLRNILPYRLYFRLVNRVAYKKIK